MKIYLFLIVFIVLINDVDAWNSYYHKSLAEKAHYSLDFETQEKLNLSLIKEGAVAPDLVFHDVVWHHYPPSYNLAKKWLDEARLNYLNKNYNEASYSFGVATHYITDSFVAPHYTRKEPGNLHSEFENIDRSYKFKTKCHNDSLDLNYSLNIGTLNKNDWGLWLLTKDNEIPKKEVEQALYTLYPVALETFNATCNNFETEIIKKKFNLVNLVKSIFS